MSVVVCRALNGGYEMAADSITVRGYTQTRGGNSSFTKLFEANGMDIGTSGTVEEASLMRLFAGTHRPARADELAILEFMSEFSIWKNDKMGDASLNNSYLIGFDGVLFHVEGWAVSVVTGYEAIGWGFDYALAALYLGHSAAKAVETAIELSVFCEGPVQTITRVVADAGS